MTSLLMIDDEPALCRSLTRLLRWRGIEVSAHTEPDAFMAAAATGAHTAVVADWNLRSCEGTGLLARLRKTGDDRPFGLISSAVTDAHGWELALAASADAYIPKSAEPSLFAAEVAALCARPRTPRTAPAQLVEIARNVGLLPSDEPNMCDIEAVASLLRQQPEPVVPLLLRLRAEIAKQTLAACGGNVSIAARQLKLSRRTFSRWISST